MTQWTADTPLKWLWARQRCVSGTIHMAGVGYHSSIGLLPQGPLMSTNAVLD